MERFYPIPTRYAFTGDSEAAEQLKGFGNKRLNDLTTELAPNSLPTGSNFYQANDGTIVTTSMNFGISTVHIHVPRRGPRRRPEGYECFCAPCIADAMVTAIKNYDGETLCQGEETPAEFDCVLDYGETVEWGQDEYKQFMGGARYYYDITICASDEIEEYEHDVEVRLENYPVQSAGWEKYSVGQVLYAMFLPKEPVTEEEKKPCMYDLLMLEPPLPQIEDIVLIQRGTILDTP